MFILAFLLGIALGVGLYPLTRNRSNQSRGSWTARLRAALILLVCGLVLVPAVAHASAVTPVGPDAQVDSLLTLDPFIVTALLGTIIPILVGLFTKASTSASVKAVALAALSVVAGMINVAATEGGGAVISEDMVKSSILTFIAAVAVHFGVLKPTGVTQAVQDVGVSD